MTCAREVMECWWWWLAFVFQPCPRSTQRALHCGADHTHTSAELNRSKIALLNAAFRQCCVSPTCRSFACVYAQVKPCSTRAPVKAVFHQWTSLRVLSTPYVYVGRKKRTEIDLNECEYFDKATWDLSKRVWTLSQSELRSIWDRSKSKAIWMWTLEYELRSI